MKNIVSNKFFLWGLLLISAFSLAYYISVRVFSFFMYSRYDKLLLISITWLIAIFFLKWIFFSFIPRILEKSPEFYSALKVLIVSFIFAIVSLLFFHDLPPFPFHHNLSMSSIEQVNPLSSGDRILLKSLIRVDLPSRLETIISTKELNLSGVWEMDANDKTIQFHSFTPTSISYNQYIQGDILLCFETAPDAGMVLVNWNGEEQILDLYSPQISEIIITNHPTFDFQHADRTRKILLSFFIFSDLILRILIIAISFVLFYQTIILKKLRVRGLGITLIMMVVSLLFFVMINQIEQEVSFTDENLEQVIRERLNNPDRPLLKSQLSTIAVLDLTYKGIRDLEGIQNLTNLNQLTADYNQITDLTPLGQLEYLSSLSLENNGIYNLKKANFDSLSHLPLKSLNLNNNFDQNSGFKNSKITDISILSSFSTLEDLELQDNQIDDISPLQNLPNLRYLNLRGNQIDDLSPLVQLTSLRELNLRENPVHDISPLVNLKNLRILNLHSNDQIISIEPVGHLKNLNTLVLQNIPIGNQISVLKSLINLNSLNVRNCALDDISVLADLMANGAIQNHPQRQLNAVLYIRDNPLLLEQTPPLAVIRPYWDNISVRDPAILPILGNPLNPPTFSKSGGFFTQEFQLGLTTNKTNLEIYYTLDGSEPDLNNVKIPDPFQRTYKYFQPITIKNRNGDPNIFSMFNTANTAQEWLPLWVPPNGEVFKATVIRAIAYDPIEKITSKTVTHTYFVDEDIFTRYPTIPIISLTADYEYLFDPHSGIYTPAIPTGDLVIPFLYNEQKVPASIEYFEIGGQLGFDGTFDISLQGSTSRSSPQKGLHVITNSWYGKDSITYPLFKNTETKANQIQEFKRFILRGWGSARAWPVMFSDAYHHTLLPQANLDIQAYQPVIVFINGEYWGLHEIREANKNPWYFYEHTGIDIIDPGYDILIGSGNTVDEGDADHWNALIQFITTHDLSNDKNYQVVTEQVDIDNFIQYIAHSIFTGKRDWPDHNEAKWRPRTEDGKWRWIQFDMDHGLNSHGRPEYDMVNHVIDPNAKPHPLFVELLKNEQFKIQFLNTFADLLNTNFHPSVETEHFNRFVSELEPYMPEFQNRWQLNQDWEEGKDFALSIIQRRAELRWAQLIKNFDLSGTYSLTLQTEPSQGSIIINQILINENTPGIDDPASWTGRYFNGIPVQISAVPLPGYQFEAWETNIKIDLTVETVVLDLTEDTSLTAVFSKINP